MFRTKDVRKITKLTRKHGVAREGEAVGGLEEERAARTEKAAAKEHVSTRRRKTKGGCTQQ